MALLSFWSASPESGSAVVSAVEIGWELDEHTSRMKETERRARLREAIRAKFQGDDKLTVKRLAEEMANLKLGLSNDPKQMLRGWQGWWAEVKK